MNLELKDIGQLIKHYTQYHHQKYIAPQKAGDDEEYMLLYKADGGKARKAFEQLVNVVEAKQTLLKKQRVSNWMNQAQFGRAYFYCFFRQLEDFAWEPGMAMRLFEEKGSIGVTWEVSVLERTLEKESLIMQHRILSVPIDCSAYYVAYQNGVETIYRGTEDNRVFLIQAVSEGAIRKVIIKEKIGLLECFETLEEFVDKAIEVMEHLYPYYLATKENR